MRPNTINNTFNRRRCLMMFGGVSSLAMMTDCTFASQPVTIGQQVWPGYDPLFLAKDLGWLNPSKVKLVQTESATHSLTLLKQGRIDAAGLTLDEVLRAREDGIPLGIILVCDISAGADQFLARPEIKSIAEIKGLRIGVEEGALGALFLHQLLGVVGLGVESVKVVSLPIDKQVEAWKRGEIDGVITYEPAASLIMEIGAKRLFDSSSLPDLIVDVLAVRTTVLDSSHSEALEHLVGAHLKGLHYLNTNPDDAALRLAPRYKLPSNQVMVTFKGLVLPNLNNNIRLLSGNPPPLIKSAITIGDILRKADILNKPVDLINLIRTDYLPEGGM